MADKLNEKLSGHQSELSYAGPGRSKKDLQRAYHKAHRAGASAEIESQLAPMDVELPDRSIGDIVPIPREEWENYSGIADDPTSGVPSEKEAYLFDLAYDVADGRADMSSNDIVDLDAHVLDQFGWSFSYSVSGHGADLSAQASRDEFYDDESIREDHERELREAIRLIIQEKILPGARISRGASSGSPEKVKEFLREARLKGDHGGASGLENNTSDPAGDMINQEEKPPAGSLTENRWLKLAGILRD